MTSDTTAHPLRLEHTGRHTTHVDVHLHPITNTHNNSEETVGYLWWVNRHTYGFWCDRNQTARTSRTRTIRQLFQTAAATTKFRLHTTRQLADQLAEDITWALAAPDDNFDALSSRTLHKWQQTGELQLADTSRPAPDQLRTLADHINWLHQQRSYPVFSDVTNPRVDDVTGPQLRDRAEHQGRTIVYCDGAAGPKPAKKHLTVGSWAWIIDPQHHDHGHAGVVEGSLQMEVQALRQAALHAPGDKLMLVTDALWIPQILTGRRDDPHQAVGDLADLLDQRDTHLAVIRGHADPIGHNLADELATCALNSTPNPYR